jgi:hypothetical protein
LISHISSLEIDESTRHITTTEEVAKVYPELVVRGDHGEVEGVRYEELAPMLLNEVQTLQRRLLAMQGQINELRTRH